MKQLINTIAVVLFILTTGCTTVIKVSAPKQQGIVLKINTNAKAFSQAFANLEEHGQSYFSFKGEVNGQPTMIHFYHGSYRGWTPKGLPTTGKLVVCHSTYQPKHLHHRMVVLSQHKTRLVLVQAQAHSTTFMVVPKPVSAHEKKQLLQGEATHAESLVPMGTLTLK